MKHEAGVTALAQRWLALSAQLKNEAIKVSVGAATVTVSATFDNVEVALDPEAVRRGNIDALNRDVADAFGVALRRVGATMAEHLKTMGGGIPEEPKTSEITR